MFRRLLDEHLRGLIRGSADAFVLKVVGSALRFGFSILVARLLGADGAGLYFLALTIATLSSTIGCFGMETSLLRFVAANAAVDDWSAVGGVYRKGMAMVLTAATVVAVVVFTAAPWLSSSFFDKPALAAPLRWGAVAILPLTLVLVFAQLLKALKRIRAAVSVESLAVPVLAIPALLLLGPTFGPVGAMWAYTAGSVLAVAIGYGVWVLATPTLRDLPRAHFDTSELLSSSLPLFAVSLMNLVLAHSGSVFLGIWATEADVGIYHVAWRTAMLTALILVAVNTDVAPKFAALYRRGEMDKLDAIARGAARLTLLLAAPPLLLFILFPGRIMGIFGPEFTAGGIVLIILAIGQLVNAATGSVGYLLTMTGHEKLMRNNLVAVAIANIVLNVIFTPRYGLISATVIAASTLAAKNLVAVGLAIRVLGIHILPWPRLSARS